MGQWLPVALGVVFGLRHSACSSTPAPDVATFNERRVPSTATSVAKQAPEATDPWAMSAGATVAPVLVRDGVPYLFERFVRGFDAARAAGVNVPVGCDEAWSDPARCPRLFDVQGMPGDAPVRATLLGADGVCVSRVGKPVAINTSECESSVTLARRLDGCVPPVAPIAWVKGDLNPELRYHAAPSPVRTTVHGRDDVVNPSMAVTLDAELRRSALELLDAEPQAPVQEGLLATVRWDAGTESLVGYEATFLLGDPGEGCDSFLSQRTVIGVERSGRFRELDELPQWDGVFSFRGTVVSVSTGAPHFAEVRTIAREGAVAMLYSQHVFSDNEECSQGSWAFIEHPCAP